MPIYAYACNECDHTLDALQKIADKPLVDCPECGAPALKKLLSAPRFRLKGQGWYETDFKKDNQRNLHGEKEPSKSAEKKEATPKSDKPSGDKSNSGDKSKKSTSESTA